jgi:rhodanese-related sulfurtransferase
VRRQGIGEADANPENKYGFAETIAQIPDIIPQGPGNPAPTAQTGNAANDVPRLPLDNSPKMRYIFPDWKRRMHMEYTKLTFAEGKRLLDAQADGVLLDVRSEEEYITGHAAGALLFPLDTINAETAAALVPNRDTLLLVYCRSGRRSQQAVHLLLELGYTQVYDLGSLVGWPYGMEW